MRRNIICLLFGILIFSPKHHLFGQTISIVATGSSGSYNTGSVNNMGVKNDGNMITLNSNVGANRGWAKFDLSAIPPGVTITSANIVFTTYSSTSSTANNNIYGFIGNPATILGTTLFSNCMSGSSLCIAQWTANAMNSLALNAAGIDFLNTNITSSQMCLSFVRGSTFTYNIYGYPGSAPDQPTLIITYVMNCSGVPDAGAIPNIGQLCIGGTAGTTLSSTGYSTSSGISFQWEESNDNGVGDAWANAVGGSGAATTSYTTPVLTMPMYYRLKATCSNGGGIGISNVSLVSLVNCEFDVSYSTSATFTSIMPANGGSGLPMPGWQNATGDDNTSTTVNITGTTFRYQSNLVTGFQVCSNGWMTFNTANTTNTPSNNLTLSSPNRVLAPFWEDLLFLGESYANRDNCIRYKVDGTLGSGSAMITIEWARMEKLNGPSANLNFQVKLFESDSHIEFIYGNFEGFDGTFTSIYSYSIGYNGINPAGTGPMDRFALQTAVTNHFSATTDPKNHVVMPPCFSKFTFTPGTYTGPVSAPTISPPANDNNTGAIVLTVNAAPCSSFCDSYYTSRSATNSGVGQACAGVAGYEDDDVWFKFTTTTGGAYDMKLRSSPSYDGVLELLNNALTQIDCANSTGLGQIESLEGINLLANTTYYLRIFHNGTGIGTSSGQFSICVNKSISPPANDEIATSTLLTVNTSCVATSSQLPNTLAATASDTSPSPACGIADDDVWYKFVSTDVNNTITVVSGASYNAAFQVLSSSDNTANGTFTELACVNQTSNAGIESYTGTFTIGNTYFIRVYHFQGGSGSGNFSICVTGASGGSPCITNVTSSADDGPGTLRQAVACATSGSTITIDASVTSITLTDTLSLNGKTLTIKDNDVNRVAININSDDAPILIGSSEVITFNNLQFIDLSGTKVNSVIKNQGNTTFIQCKISGNGASVITPKITNIVGIMNTEGLNEVRKN